MHLKPTDIVRRTNSIEHNYEYIYILIKIKTARMRLLYPYKDLFKIKAPLALSSHNSINHKIDL